MLQKGAAVYCVIEGELKSVPDGNMIGTAGANYYRRLRRGDYFLMLHDAIGRFRLTVHGTQVAEYYA